MYPRQLDNSFAITQPRVATLRGFRPGCGSPKRIVGELRKLRLRICPNTVRSILLESGLTPSPHRNGRPQDTA